MEWLALNRRRRRMVGGLSWLPSGALWHMDFANQQYYQDGASVDSFAITNSAHTGGLKTIVDSDGLLKWAGGNILLNTATLSTQNVTTTAHQYTLSFKGTGTVTLSGTSTAGPLVGTGANDRVSLNFTPTAGTLTLTVSGSVTVASLYRTDLGGMQASGISGDTTYFQTAGSPYYHVAFDHDPANSNAPLGAVFENTSTRLTLEPLGVLANMQVVGASVVDQSYDALGVFTGVKVSSLGATWHSARQLSGSGAALTSGSTYYFDIILKKEELDTVRLGLFKHAVGDLSYVDFTFSTLSFGTPVDTAGPLTEMNAKSMGSDIVRATGKFVPNETRTYAVQINPNTATTGDGVTFLAGFITTAQAGSLIMGSDGSTVARTADTLAGVTTGSLPFVGYSDGGAGTIVLTGRLQSVVNSQYLFSLSDGSTANFIGIRVSSAGKAELVVNDTSVAQASISSVASMTAGDEFTIAVAWDTNDFAISLNGETAVADVSGSVPTSIAQWNVGAPAGGSVGIGFHLVSATYYPERKADLEGLAA